MLRGTGTLLAGGKALRRFRKRLHVGGKVRKTPRSEAECREKLGISPHCGNPWTLFLLEQAQWYRGDFLDQAFMKRTQEVWRNSLAIPREQKQFVDPYAAGDDNYWLMSPKKSAHGNNDSDTSDPKRTPPADR